MYIFPALVFVYGEKTSWPVDAVLLQDVNFKSPLDSENSDASVVEPINPDIVNALAHDPELQNGTLVASVTVIVAL